MRRVVVSLVTLLSVMAARLHVFKDKILTPCDNSAIDNKVMFLFRVC